MINGNIFKLKKDGKLYKQGFCRNPELIENYEKAVADTTQVWECHHRMEAVYTRKELIKYGLYYDCEPHQLIFLTIKEHNSLHHKGNQYSKGKHLSEDAKAKLSAAKKGKKGKLHSEETKEKIAASLRGSHLSEERKAKISAAHKGKKRSDEFRKKRSEYMKGKHWKLVDGKRVYY